MIQKVIGIYSPYSERRVLFHSFTHRVQEHFPALGGERTFKHLNNLR